MHTLSRSPGAHFALVLSFLALGAAACANDHSVAGTWRQPNATTMLPVSVGGGTLNIDATLTFDDHASPGTFEMKLGLGALGLTDDIDAHGTYVATGTELTLTFTGFTIDPASGNTSMVSAGGSQCIVLHGFLDSTVCFPAPQSSAYTLSGNTLTMTVAQAIAGDAVSYTHFTLTKSS